MNKNIARILAVMVGISLLSGCFYGPPGQYEHRGDGYYVHRGDNGDGNGDGNGHCEHCRDH